MNPIIEVKNFTKTINNKIIFKDLNFSINKGDKLFLTGQSGVGKSLLIRSIVGFEKLDEGQVLWNGNIVNDSNIREFRHNILYLSQKATFINGTVIDNLKYIYKLKINHNDSFNIDKIHTLLKTINKEPDFLNKQTRSLSGGESQLVSIIRALQMNPQVLFLDEVTSALDHSSILLFEKLINNWIQEDKNRAYIWISHNNDQIARLAENIYLMENSTLKIAK